MHKSTTMLAIAAAAFAIACDRPAGEGSAADQQEERSDMEQAAPTGEPQQPQQPTAIPPPDTQAADNVRRAGELRVADITRDPDARLDQVVVVVGEVEDMLGARAFKLNDEAPMAAGADDDIVVLGKERGQWTMDDTKGDARVRVSGKLMKVPAANLERELGWNFDDKLQSAVEDERVVLIAQSVERIEGGAQPGEREPVRGTQQQQQRMQDEQRMPQEAAEPGERTQP